MVVRKFLHDLSLLTLDPPPRSFQDRVAGWVVACLGNASLYDTQQRSCRLFEEVAELMQAADLPLSHCVMLLDYVYKRPIGDLAQEVGGVMTALAAFCTAFDGDMVAAGEAELVRITGRMEEIRLKDANKPKGSPLPGSLSDAAGSPATDA